MFMCFGTTFDYDVTSWLVGNYKFTSPIECSIRDEYRTHYKALYKCPVYFTYLLSHQAFANAIPTISNSLPFIKTFL